MSPVVRERVLLRRKRRRASSQFAGPLPAVADRPTVTTAALVSD
jgi:hypothetical protein